MCIRDSPWTVHSVPRNVRTPKIFAVDDWMQITALYDIFVITRWRHELYTYNKWELLGLFRLQLQTITVQKITLITGKDLHHLIICAN